MNLFLRKALVVAAFHVAIVGTLGGKLLIDRATRPRVWARSGPVDPNLPIRGRYVRLSLEAAIGNGLDFPAQDGGWNRTEVALVVQDQQLVARRSSESTGVFVRPAGRAGQRIVVLDPPVAYFIPEHATDPSRRLAGEELWVEVTIPRRGPPRPIRLGVKKDGVLSPLDL
jgi:hypothetical protein